MKSICYSIIEEVKKQRDRIIRFMKWLFISGIIGIVVGNVGTAFYYGMHYVTEFRNNNTYIIYLA